MNRITIFTYLLVLVGCEQLVPAKVIDFEELVRRDGVFYKKFSNEAFKGSVTGSHVGELVDGQWNGEVLIYSLESGNLERSENYRLGALNGERHWYSKSGSLVSISDYVNDEWIRSRSFDGGLITQDSQLKNGVRHGTHIAYHKFIEKKWYSLDYEHGRVTSGVVLTTSNDDQSYQYRIDALEIPLENGIAHGIVRALDSGDRCYMEFSKGKAIGASGNYDDERLSELCAYFITKSVPRHFKSD